MYRFFGRYYSRGGLVLALAQITLPLMVLPIINSMLRIDDRLQMMVRVFRANADAGKRGELTHDA